MLVSDPSKIKIDYISGSTVCFYWFLLSTVCFYWYVQVKVHQNISKLRYNLLLLTYTKFFLKEIKWVWNLFLYLIFCMLFEEKVFPTLYSINWRNFIAWLSLLLEILRNMCIITIYCPVCDVIKAKIKLFFSINPFSLITK